jgi:tungstate transport system ATP-binding protein
MTLYTLDNICKEFQGRRVLDSVSLTLEAGKVYSLIGPNGAGKTTLLHILAFLTKPSGGTLSFKGRPVRFERQNLTALRKNVVLVNQQPILFSTSVYNNVAFGLKTRKIPKSRRAFLAAQALSQVGMTQFSHAGARHLSGGETRRIAIARALACMPEVLLLDEPTADLDVENRNAVEAIITDIAAKSRMTLIFCTHDHDQAARLTPHAIRLQEGRLTDLIHENIFRGEAVVENNRFFCRVTDAVRIPILPTDQKKIRVSIHPTSIEVVDAFPEAGSTDTGTTPIFTGKIIALQDAGAHIRLRIDIGVSLQLLMEKSQYAARNIRIGERAVIRFDPAGVTVLDNQLLTKPLN